jgi:D-alanine-D-alanine ligase
MKKHVLIIFGGKSGEHEVSVRSATSIEQSIDRSRYETHCLGVTQDGHWHYGQTIAEVTDGKKVLPPNTTVSLPDGIHSDSLAVSTQRGTQPLNSDIIFPIIHGTNGEDGTVQGLLELSNLPYVGSGVLGSAVAMDKVIQKTLCQAHHIPQTKFLSFTHLEWKHNSEKVMQQIQENLTFPVFVKPANLGSSVGISKVKTPEQLATAITEALAFDTKIVVEEGVENILEVEVGVLGNDTPQASVCGSIHPNTEFYDYETKYVTDDIVSQIPADIPQEISEQIRQTAIDTFKALNCLGLARVDFFYQLHTQRYFLNELNTLPGFTSISQYPKLWEASGLSYTDLITRLLELAEEKWAIKQQLRYTYND